MDQFSGGWCYGNGTDGKSNKLFSNVNIKCGSCINIDGATHTIFLARGTGLVYRRNIVACAEIDCPANMRIEKVL